MVKLVSEDQFFFLVIISKRGEKGTWLFRKSKKDLSISGHLKETDFSFLTVSFLAHTGDMGFCYLSYLNIQVAVDNADLSGKTKMRK